jgi:ribosomal protection tetracycline resistance protein
VLRRTLNLGILAHVDAGKTTLTERLLYAAGVIGKIGSVDRGTTQTDSLALERERGITIKSAVVSFAIDDVTVNLIDTPGHPDFIAEVERVLSVLDGAVLVISAVEGVQPQTRLLMRALVRLGVPTLMFVNKIDRRGAGDDRVLQAIRDRLTPAIVAMGSVHDLGTRAAGFTAWGAADEAFTARLADVLVDHDDALLAAYVDGAGVQYARLREQLAAQSKQALMHPVFFGSALTGAGVDSLMSGIAELLPAAARDADGLSVKRPRSTSNGPPGPVRRSNGCARSQIRSWPRSGCASSRPQSAPAWSSGSRSSRLAGHRLHGDDDALGLSAAAEPCASAFQQELECEFDRYEPVSGTSPARRRTDNNPLNREEYLLHVERRLAARLN